MKPIPSNYLTTRDFLSNEILDEPEIEERDPREEAEELLRLEGFSFAPKMESFA